MAHTRPKSRRAWRCGTVWRCAPARGGRSPDVWCCAIARRAESRGGGALAPCVERLRLTRARPSRCLPTHLHRRVRAPQRVLCAQL
eukprot:4570994-Prymnesium_polylepis.1